jgi:hydrogenase maturation protease
MYGTRILIACIGNLAVDDQAFGEAVSRGLAGRRLPADIRVVDFGVRGIDLTYALLARYQCVVLVDGMHGGPCGTLYVIEPDGWSSEQAAALPWIDANDFSSDDVLRLAEALGGRVDQVLPLAHLPRTMRRDPASTRLSGPVAKVVDEAIDVIGSLARRSHQLQPARRS